MIKIENTKVYGFSEAIRGMRNPMNSWDKSDSWYGCKYGDYGHSEARNCGNSCKADCEYCIGNNDLDLMKKLVSAGTDHRKFMRMITVYADITAPLYWWKEFDTYKVGTVRNSCSTMHKITEKEFTLDDFSHEHLSNVSIDILNKTISCLNFYRLRYKMYDKYKSGEVPLSKEVEQNLNDYSKKDIWWQIIQLLPSSYNQKATVMLNYEVLANIYHSRKNHKLDEWRDFCKRIESLPYSEIITGECSDNE